MDWLLQNVWEPFVAALTPWLIISWDSFATTFTWSSLTSLAFDGFIGVWIALFVAPLIPNVIERLTNKPNRERGDGPPDERKYPVSEFGFFTQVLPGRVKIIERGGEFIRCVMSYEGHVFRGEVPGETINGRPIQPNDDAYWEVRVTPADPGSNAKDSHPLPFPRKMLGWRSVSSWLLLPFLPIRLLWWFWKRWVYRITGFVFTGIYPFQKVRTYPLEYFRKIKRESGADDVVRILDYSDHFRVADFQFPVRVPSADTADKIPVKVLADVMARVFNPYQTAYWIDDWSARATAAISDQVTHFTRPKPLDEVLSAPVTGDVRALSNSLLAIGKRPGPEPENSLVPIGIEISQALIPDISLAKIEDDNVKKLADLAFARVDRQAQEERAKGRAAELRQQAEATRDNGHIGLAVLAAERNVRTAAAAGEKAIVVVGGSADADPIQAAILHELKKQNEGSQP